MTTQELYIKYPTVSAVIEQLRQHPYYGQDAIYEKLDKGVPFETILEFINGAGYEVTYALSLRKREMTRYDVVVVDCLFAIEKYDDVHRGNLIRLANLFLSKSSFLSEERSCLREWLGFIERAKDNFDKEYYFYCQPYCLKHIIDPAITPFWDLEFFQANSIVLNHDKAQMSLYVPAWFTNRGYKETVDSMFSYAEYGRFDVIKSLQYV